MANWHWPVYFDASGYLARCPHCGSARIDPGAWGLQWCHACESYSNTAWWRRKVEEQAEAERQFWVTAKE